MKHTIEEESIKKYLQDYLPQIDYLIPNINNGGCGFFALLLYRKLREFGIRVNILAYLSSTNKYDLDYYRETGLKYFTAAADHIVIQLDDGSLFDSTGIVPYDEWEDAEFTETITEHELDILVNHATWNNRFSRFVYGDRLKALIDNLKLPYSKPVYKTDLILPSNFRVRNRTKATYGQSTNGIGNGRRAYKTTTMDQF